MRVFNSFCFYLIVSSLSVHSVPAFGESEKRHAGRGWLDKPLLEVIKEDQDNPEHRYGQPTGYVRERRRAQGFLLQHLSRPRNGLGQTTMRDIVCGTVALERVYAGIDQEIRWWRLIEELLYDKGLSPSMPESFIRLYDEQPDHPVFARMSVISGIPSIFKLSLAEDFNIHTVVQWMQVQARLRGGSTEAALLRVSKRVAWRRAQELIDKHLNSSSPLPPLAAAPESVDIQSPMWPELLPSTTKILRNAGIRSREELRDQVARKRLLEIPGLSLRAVADIWLMYQSNLPGFSRFYVKPGELTLDASLVKLLKRNSLVHMADSEMTVVERQEKSATSRIIAELQLMPNSPGALTLRQIIANRLPFASLYPPGSEIAELRMKYSVVERAFFTVGLDPEMPESLVRRYELDPQDPVFTPVWEVAGLTARAMRALEDLEIGTVHQFLRLKERLEREYPDRPYIRITSMGKKLWESASTQIAAHLQKSSRRPPWPLTEKTLRVLQDSEIAVEDLLSFPEAKVLSLPHLSPEAATEIWLYRESAKAEGWTACEELLSNHTPRHIPENSE